MRDILFPVGWEIALPEFFAERGQRVCAVSQLRQGSFGTLYRLAVENGRGVMDHYVMKHLGEYHDLERVIAPLTARELSPFAVPIVGVIHSERGYATLAPDRGLPVREKRPLSVDALTRIVDHLVAMHITLSDRAGLWHQQGILPTLTVADTRAWMETGYQACRAALRGERVDWEKEAAHIAWFCEQRESLQVERFTMTHGDAHLGNLFDQDGRLEWIDWAFAAYAPPQRDLAVLVQDLAEETLHDMLRERMVTGYARAGWDIDRQAFARAYAAAFFENTWMMIGFDLQARLDETTEAQRKTRALQKLSWIARAWAEMTR
ncbi:phosphotransferase [Ferroacidibacillus organovorans]|uniref:Aminoglycoside phosphotransferase domain-containing protein n=1 Tax=Ferroacidibacillus organovorans TaxID=1765683 RepID=A0A101XQ28_9BACL|nr:phosphotransferase [Ferroacidibacillus organovorans]KUO95483.1 hypothetical protein ATW55_03220 [Ferroacidibacillus organovorans]